MSLALPLYQAILEAKVGKITVFVNDVLTPHSAILRSISAKECGQFGEGNGDP